MPPLDESDKEERDRMILWDTFCGERCSHRFGALQCVAVCRELKKHPGNCNCNKAQHVIDPSPVEVKDTRFSGPLCSDRG